MYKEHYKDKNPVKERRKDPRASVQIWAKEKSDKYTCFHLISNLSCSGLFIEKKLPFSIGSVLNFELELTDSEEKIPLKGIVVDNYTRSDLDFIGTGIKFIEMSKNDKKKIEKYLRQIEKKL